MRLAVASVLISLPMIFAVAACNRAKEPTPDPAAKPLAPAPAVPATPTPLLPQATTQPAAAQHFGEPIAATTTVALADIAKSPKTYKGKTIVTTGTVSAVCQERGCWMEITDKDGDANVRMHGHSFFVPKTSNGKKARVQGTVVLVKDGKECEEMAATGAQLELDATGVELM